MLSVRRSFFYAVIDCIIINGNEQINHLKEYPLLRKIKGGNNCTHYTGKMQKMQEEKQIFFDLVYVESVKIKACLQTAFILQLVV